MAQPLSAPLAASRILDAAPPPTSERPGARPARRAGTPGRRGARGGRLDGGQRQSASEREKLRMRTLARALHELRRFLPPSVVPAGQSLTKIETLRLAIRYIGHLSAVLGLSEDSLRRRRRRRVDAGSPRGCPLCPDGGPGLGSAACGGASWESPPAGPGSRDAREPYAERASPEPATGPIPSPLFSSDVLALLETWMPLSLQEWTPA